MSKFAAASRESAEMLQETADRVFTNAATAQNRARMVAGNAPEFKVKVRPATARSYSGSAMRLVESPVCLSPIHRGSRSTLKISAASGVFQQAGFAKLLRLVPLSGTQPRSRAVPPNVPGRRQNFFCFTFYQKLFGWGRSQVISM
jgi:hypothetical protein